MDELAGHTVGAQIGTIPVEMAQKIPKTTGATPLLSNTSAGEATGVGVRLMDKNDGNIVLGSAAPDLDLDASSSEQTLNFFAWMEQIDNAVDVTAGEVTANATYALDYK